jgi:hypothetical protein
MSWSESGARTGPHEIGLIANIVAKNDDDAARRLYRKYRMAPASGRGRRPDRRSSACRCGDADAALRLP